MRYLITRFPRISSVLACAALVCAACSLWGCGANDTFSPTTQGGGVAGGFTLTVNPGSRAVTPGASATYTVTATSTGGFSSPVTLSTSGLPAGASATFAPPTVTPTPAGAASTLTIATSSGTGDLNGTIRSSPATPDGSYTITITAAGGGVTRTATAQLVVQSTLETD